MQRESLIFEFLISILLKFVFIVKIYIDIGSKIFIMFIDIVDSRMFETCG